MPLSAAASASLAPLAARAERYTGADLESVCREAALCALRESRGAGKVEARHFEEAVAAVKPSLSVEMLEQYEGFTERFGVGTRKM
ncbi:hypothetical protein BC830DRAFT_331992 [Chytriomyces sp. MP71]|nr:hypothetical protein BC830DRAFT_331992 [Chytriomyces sp. MP71]